jgi:putative ABC transport system permease protein
MRNKNTKTSTLKIFNAMFKNYLKIAFRNLVRNKTFSFINIGGLAVGLLTCLFITLFIKDELSFDCFFSKADRIYQVNTSGNFGGEEFLVSNTPPPVGETMMKEFPEIETFTRIFRPYPVTVRHEKEGKEVDYFTEREILAADSNFFQVFDYAFVEGDAKTCLQGSEAVVISEKIAKKYFGEVSNALGKNLIINDMPLTVKAVLKDLPSQATLQFDFLTNISRYKVVQRFHWSWVWLQVSTYIVLNEQTAQNPASAKALEAKFPSMIKKHAVNAFNRIGQPYEEFIKKGGRWDLLLQPLTKLHLHSAGVGGYLTTLGNIRNIYIFSTVAILIIVLACVNFMNLATAQSLKRAKEVGVRKVLGSQKKNLVAQFLIESSIYSFIASLLALVMAYLLLPFFNQISGKTFATDALFSNELLGFVLVLTLLMSLLAGSYPAFYLTSFKPVQVLKNGIIKNSFANLFVRNGLVVFQFMISTALIISMIIIFKQLDFTQNKDLGLDKENVLVISQAAKLEGNKETFAEELGKLPNVGEVSISTSYPTKDAFGDFYVPEQSKEDKQVAKDLLLFSFMTDEKFTNALNIKIIEGRGFSKQFNDSTSVILNEAAVKQIGWKNPIGKTLTYPGGNNQKFQVVGVMKNFDVESAYNLVTPFALFHTSSNTYRTASYDILVRVNQANLAETIESVGKKWKSLVPNEPFNYTFLDAEFAAMYRSEQRMSKIFGIFTGLSIAIACLGLFGLVAFITERRTKEIGIRKVLGASILQITTLLSKDFLKLVMIAFVIASPIAYYFMDKWLADFAYRITISWWIFALAGVSAIGIALITVGWQSIKAAVANPVKSLRSE